MKKFALLTGVALLSAASLAASAQTSLRIGLQEDPDTLDPVRARTYVSRIVFTSLCDKLIDIDHQLNFVPQLATSWSWNDDNTVLTFKLRTDVRFHDGAAFDAAAAKANLDRALTLETSQRRSELASVKSVSAPDPETLVITVTQPDATLLAQLSDRAGMMLSPATFQDEDKNPVARHPVCSGPYEFVSRVQNDKMVFKKFEGYYNAQDYHIDRLEFLPIPDTTVRLQNLRSGGIDMLERVSASDLAEVESDKNLKLEAVTGLGYQQIIFNLDNGPRAKNNPFTNKLARQALQLTIDRNAINEVLGMGTFTPAQTPFAPASPYHDDTLLPVTEPDIAKAKALLAEAGLADGIKAELTFGNDTITTSLAEMLQAMAGQAGIHLELRPSEFAAMLNDSTQGKFDIEMMVWSGRVDPDANIYNYVGCKGYFNDGHYCNEEAEALLLKARSEPDTTRRKALYDEAQNILQDELPVIYIHYQPWPFVTRTYVKGFKAHPDGMIRLRNVAVDKS